MAATTTAAAIALLIYCVSCTLLTLANKLAVVAFPVPNLLLVFQNAVTVLLLLALTALIPGSVGGPLPPLTLEAVRTWLPLTLLFVGMLASSLLALQHVSAVTLIVIRNLSTLAVAFFERLVLGTEISTLSVASLLGLLAGAVLHGLYDMRFSAAGYVWLMINIVCTVSFQIYVKGLIAGLPKKGPGALGPFGMSYYNNMISLPVFALLALAVGELPRLPDLFVALSTGGAIAVVVSALLGFALSTSAFLVNKLFSATSMMVANNVNKFALIIISEIAVETTLGSLPALGAFLVLLFGWLYTQSKGPWATGSLHQLCQDLGTPKLLLLSAAMTLTCAAFVAQEIGIRLPTEILAFPPSHTSNVTVN